MSDNTERSTSGRAIHALAGSRRRSIRAPNSPAASISGSDDASTFNPDNDDALMSTKHNITVNEDDSRYLAKLRTTAQNYRYYDPRPPVQVASSAVRREFHDFDHSNSTDDEDSIEVGRGGVGNTPSKPNKSLDSEILLEIGNSHYESARGTPPSKQQKTPKSNLRKQAQLRRASSTRVGAVKGLKENDSPMMETRFNSRTVSANNDAYHQSLDGTPRRANGTPRGVANSTAQSFMIPNIEGVSELFALSSMNDTGLGLPRAGLTNKRAASMYNANSNFNHIQGVPIPADEKHILASLELLKDRLNELETERDEANARLEEYELHVADLQAQIDAQSNLRRSDSALGSSDGEGTISKQSRWKIEKAQMEASTSSMQRRLDQAERKITLAETATKRVTSERDTLATQLSVAYLNIEELKSENEVLANESRLLQDQVSDLQTENRALVAENDELRAQLDASHERHEDETQGWRKKEAALNRKANTNDRAILQENQTLRDELVRAREQQEQDARKAARREEKARKEAEHAANVEHAKLMQEKEQLVAELDQAKKEREAELKRWTSQQRELQARIDEREETIHLLKDGVPQDIINDDLRKENEALKAELATLRDLARASAAAEVPSREEQGTPKDVLRRRLEEVTNMHVDAEGKWERKEKKMQDHLEHVREVNELYRELEAVREGGRTAARAATTKRNSTGQIRQEEITRTRARSKSQSRRFNPPRNHRHVSAPITTQAEDGYVSDASTTNLSFDPAILAGAPHSGGKGKRATGFVPVNVHTGDTTYLPFIHGDEIAKLRKRIEEEHLAARARKSHAATTAEEDVGTGYVRRRGSFKDLTSCSRASSLARSVLSAHADHESDPEDDVTTGTRKSRNETAHSHLSRTSVHSRSRPRRRSSTAFQEMTSAFIIPDITLHSQRDLTTREVLAGMKSTAHDIKNCSVCQRILSSSSIDIDDLDIPAPVPVTTRPEYKENIDATLRPAQSPAKALAKVIKELQDELQHLRLKFSILNSRLQSSDPAMGKRASDKLHRGIAMLNRAIAVKEGQLYDLHDVCEAHREELAQMKMGEDGGNREDEKLPEEVERTLENVLTARGGHGLGRRVEFESESESEGEGAEGSEWPGISDDEL